ncbi:hypothetical protein JG687_00001470 [Phytophthora cactorum]|uniref:WRKY19-like zinc finger domain-containing protein n=1 Tax=Phytophthora cactorum TaxID=29920 RepID=A0A8T1UX67_9STRA|nr:hypothetical protein JG687_00001470 [Phytophthora cactorum]
MEAEEEAREVATASAALFGGTEGEPRFDDDDGMDGSDLPPSFAMPMLPRGDEEEDAAAPSSVPREEAEKQMEDANLQPQETMADTTEAHVTQTDGQQPETTTDTDDSAMEAADRRCYQCRFENCPKFAQGGGLCIAHGGGYRCQTPFCAFFNLRTCPDHGGSKRCGVTGCTRVAQGTSALCCAHGGGRKCSVKKCDKYDAGLGLCLAHGGGRDCTMNDCTKKAIRYGLCSGHGGRARCKVEGCEKYDRGQGKCKAHGGGYFCKVQGCNKKDKGGGLCVAHDDAKLKAVAIGLSMEVDASNTAAQGSVALVVGATNTTKEVDTALHTVIRFGRCCAHGGKPRCTVEGCERLGQARGLCKAHGGTKPCSFPDCTRKANSGGHCIRHGGGGRCKTEGCVKTNRGGGYCKAHGGGKKCTVPDCNDWAIGGGVCPQHELFAAAAVVSV